MKHLALPATATEAFDHLFESARHTMFKVEVLQDYSAVDDCPSLRAWLVGNQQDSRALGAHDERLIAYRNKCLNSQATITRVHVVKTPHSPYLEWEIQVCYKDSLLAHGAESILLVDADELRGITLPAGDFWIFDDKQVLQWEYKHGAGEVIGATLWDEDKRDSIDQFRQLKAFLLTKATAATEHM